VIRVPPQRGGWLEVVCGPMFSGKSEEMIRRLRRAEIAGQRVVIFKPRIDDRYDATDVVSHAGARMRAVPIGSVADIDGALTIQADAGTSVDVDPFPSLTVTKQPPTGGLQQISDETHRSR